MNLKICTKCKLNKPLNDFYSRKTGPRKDKFYENCRDCMKARGRLYYQSNRERQLSLANKRRSRYRLAMRVYINKLKNVPCMDCGIKYPPYVMDFDHRDRRGKEIDVGRMINGGCSREKVDKEVLKCDIVCSNCHRVRTYSNFAEVAKVVTAHV